MSENGKRKRKKKRSSRTGRIVGRVLLIVLETLLLAVGALYAVMAVYAKGPSPTASKEFILSLRETSAIGFLAEWFYTPEEIAAMKGDGSADVGQTDASLINLDAGRDKTAEPAEGPQKDDWGLVDEDGDGIILEKVNGKGYFGYMMVVLDPSRVIMGSVPSSFGYRGYTVEEMVQYYDAVGGINAGGFEDAGGRGNGSTPDSLVVFDGKTYYANKGVRDCFVGFDENHILHVGRMNAQQIQDAGISSGCCFGPALIIDGNPVDASTLASGLNPRTAIGQRSDGAVLMLVIEGRQATSVGARYQDLVDIMLAYGAMNACNLDGGSSSLMYYNDSYVNNSASVIGIRPVPTSFLVLKEGVEVHG